MAGRYVYGDQPDDIFGRHDNCDCTVTFENGRQRQDVWSKRTWEAPEEGAGAGELNSVTPEQAEKKREETKLHVLTNAGKRDIIKPDGVVDDKKIVEFFLNPESKHGNEFLGVGYSADNPELLKQDLLEALRTSERNPMGETEFGERFSIDAMLGVTEKRNFQLIWQISKTTGIPRLITGHRRKKGRK